MEEWKTVSGFENYEVSNKGRVRSRDYTITDLNGHTYAHRGKILNTAKIGRGYESVSLCREGKRSVLYVHRLVAEAFVSNPFKKNVINHIDGDKENNTSENLEWVTYSENNQHAYSENLKPKGSDFYNAKLTRKSVQDIRSEYPIIKNFNYFAKKYNVSRATVRDVVNRKTWKNI